jgi:methanogenic corrinoid protein MtbC1
MDELNQEATRILDRRRGELAETIVAAQYDLQPYLGPRYGEAGRAKCVQDVQYHLAYLAEAIASASPALFADYVAWARVLLAGLNLPAEHLATNLRCMRDVLWRQLPGAVRVIVCDYVAGGIQQLLQPTAEPSSFILDGALHASLAQQYLDALLQYRRHDASQMILGAVSAGVTLKDIYLHVFQPCQYEIGRLWQLGRVSVAQEHYCTAATQLVMSQLYPALFAASKRGRRLVAACIAGDLHELGARMIADFFEIEGWDTIYLGANTPVPGIIETLARHKADLLAVSATMTFHVRAVRDLITAVRASPACEGVKILVGGYPFNVAPQLWRAVGADGSAGDAQAAVALAQRLLSKARGGR